MTPEIIWRYLHFIAIFGVVGALTVEHLLLEKQMSRKAINRLVMAEK